MGNQIAGNWLKLKLKSVRLRLRFAGPHFTQKD